MKNKIVTIIPPGLGKMLNPVGSAMEPISNDALSIIFEYLSTKDLIMASRSCKQWRYVFSKYIGRYKLNLYPWRNKITDSDLQYLKGARNIDLYGCVKITDAGLEHLRGVKTINISGCELITRQGLKNIECVDNNHIILCYFTIDQCLQMLNK